MNVPTKKCYVCNSGKSNKDFRVRQDVCVECENNPSIHYTKLCKLCQENKDLIDFYENNTCCKECAYERSAKVAKEKECVACHNSKNRSDFRRGQIVCHECEKNPDVEYEKECRDCHEMKSNNMFRRNRKECTDCERSSGREYRRTTTKAKEWVDSNKERMTTLQKEWYEENKPHIREKESHRKKTDPVYRKIKSYRSTIGNLLSGKCQMNKSLAVNRNTFTMWLKFCFSDDMTIENHHSVWHVDHVLPLDLLYDTCKSACFQMVRNTKDHEKSLLCWYNTFPLTIGENRSKSNQISSSILSNHLTILNNFFETHRDIEKDELYSSYVKLIRSVIDSL